RQRFNGGAARTKWPASSTGGATWAAGGSMKANGSSSKWKRPTAACSSCILTPPTANGGCTASMTRAAGLVHLHVNSPFSFLDGAASIDELVHRAAALEMPALALTDHDNVSGAVRFVQACSEAGIKPIIGCELTLEGGHHLTVLAASPKGYANLCRLLTAAHLENERGPPRTSWSNLKIGRAHV